MRPSDARYIRPSMDTPRSWLVNEWHTGPYMSVGIDQEDSRNAVDFSKDGEEIWLLEDYQGTKGEYFIMNKIMTKVVCTHNYGVGVQLSWFDRNELNNDEDLCKWQIEFNRAETQFRLKSTVFTVQKINGVGFIYFDKTGVYFEYDELYKNFPEHKIEEHQMWWTFVKSSDGSREYNDIEQECELGASGLPTFMETTSNNTEIGARGYLKGRRKRGKTLISRGRFATCKQNWYLYKNKCYRVFKDFRVTQRQAKKVCDYFGSKPFVPRNRYENKYAVKLVKVLDRSRGFYWMGLELDDYGDFKDHDGNNVDFVKWPRARSSFAADSCAIWKRRWYRANCASTHKVICEREADEKLTGSCGKIQDKILDNIMLKMSKPTDVEGKVVGGETANYGQFPWQVGIRFREPIERWAEDGSTIFIKHQCGGALIDECWVLSAAHCFKDLDKDDFFVRLGDLNNESDEPDEGEQDFDIDDVIIHENYEAYPSPRRDIALVKLRRKHGKCANMTNEIQPICLPGKYKEKNDEKCQVSGWGQTNVTVGLTSAKPNLQYATLPILPDKYCASRYNRRGNRYFEKSSMFCAGLKEGGKDACTGDSGGPYACRNQDNGRYQITGVVSFGIGCARKKYPGVYTRVREFVPWITSKIKANGGGNVITKN